MIQVYSIPIPKDSLLRLPKDERVCLLQLGHMANQVLMFEKLLIFATTLDSKNEVEQYTTGVQKAHGQVGTSSRSPKQLRLPLPESG